MKMGAENMTQILTTTKTERFHRFIESCLQDDIDSLRGWPLAETATNFGIGILMFLMASLHLVISATQLAFSLIATVGDLLVKGLTIYYYICTPLFLKIMPVSRVAGEQQRASEEQR